MDQHILFHKPNKKVMSKKKMDHFIRQTKHTLSERRVHSGLQVKSATFKVICLCITLY
jgi:hypothetical protein